MSATRFAPSPTGLLHVGNARTALINWLVARASGGSFLLRLDDTDRERSEERYADAIQQDMRWLGLDWDRLERQSGRQARYDDAIATLKAAGRLYACYETPEELSLKRAALRQAGRPPIYDRAALNLTDVDKATLEGEGRRPHWRFLLRAEAIEWDDRVHGAQHFEAENLSDPVLIREDGYALYTLTSVVDDIELGIDTVIRGDDHVSNTATQIQLFRALGAEPPAFAHHSLLAGADGEKLSKRIGSLSLRQLREAGYEPMTVNSVLARIGSADPIEPFTSLDQLVASFDLGRLGRNPARFGTELLDDLNPKVLHATDYAQVAARLGDLGVDGPALWDAVRGNLSKLDEARDWARICIGPVEPLREELAFLDEAADLLPEDLDWSAWTGALKQKTGRKGRALFRPLRLALTGRDHGPEMAALLPLIGRRRAEARLRGQTA
ncbi:MAG: glutamate--tRNA ligase [Alphaproteobacteria bacterium]